MAANAVDLIDPLRTLDRAIAGMVRGVLAPPAYLSKELERFQAVRAKTLDLLGQVTEEQAAWSPRAGEWSIVQIADHMLRSEELHRGQFQRLLEMARSRKGRALYVSFEEVNTTAVFVPRAAISILETPVRMFTLFVPHVLRRAIVRYPLVAALNPNASEPRGDLSLSKLRVDLAASIEATTKLLQGPLPADLERLTIDHPVIGSNNIVELLSIMSAHEERHQGQIQRLRKNTGFPKGTATAGMDA
jgi:uncharacterized damage-inducible protein DinB